MPFPRDLVHDAQLVALAAVGGAMDAAAYLRVHVFTANMTGNAVVSGLALGGAQSPAGWHAVGAIIAFIVGVGVGTALRDTRRILILEAFTLGAFVLLGNPHAVSVRTLILTGAMAMGLQTAATRSAHGTSASSTFMTGTLARATAATLEAFRDAARASVALLSGLTFLVYLAAAVIVGALAAHHVNVFEDVPLAALAVVIIIALSPQRGGQEKR